MEKGDHLSFDHVRIRQIREHRLLSQIQVAKYLGISQSSYNDLEQGRTRLKAETIPVLARLLEVDIRCFFETGTIYHDQIRILDEQKDLMQQFQYLQKENESLNQLLIQRKITCLVCKDKNEQLLASVNMVSSLKTFAIRLLLLICGGIIFLLLMVIYLEYLYLWVILNK